ncbi:helix-turn-helix domain-containing protein [Lacticaseibacillus pantheris]|uniref:helix-turn-helix domain-containing protein n=1 Tax=Lacticaseibacillus pantheris TaxID=171523 RepID=UPI000A421510|nr:helix-turn-helix domain-containing protein [Lacticaseibacillus pantheris]
MLRYLEDTGARLRTDYFRLPMSKRDLAGWLSITPETLSRNLKRLVREGRIEMQGQMVRLL